MYNVAPSEVWRVGAGARPAGNLPKLTVSAPTLALQLAVFISLVAAAAAQSTVPLECAGAAPWRNLPLATKPAPLSALDLSAWQSYVKSIIPHMAGPAVALVTALVLLLSFVVWRLVNCCACCAKRHSGKTARKVLAGGGARRLKAALLLLASGVLAGAIYGVVQVESGLVDDGIGAIDSVTQFLEDAVAAGQGTVDAAVALDAQLLAMRGELESLAVANPLLAGPVSTYISSIDGAHDQLGGFTGFSSDLESLRASTVVEIQSAVDQYSPLAQKADKGRVIGLYVAFGVLAGLGVITASGALLDWPALVKPLVLMLLILMLLAWLIVLALTAVMRVGNDVCVNAEPKALSLSSSISLCSAGSATALVEYYLYGTGGSLLEVLNTAMGLDVPAALDQANATLLQLQTAIAGQPLLAASLADDTATLNTLFADVATSVDSLVVALSYSAFHPVWVGLKGFVCCDVLNSVGATWTGLIACGSCCIMLLVLLFVWIGRMDSLRAMGCCHIYSARDYTLEGEGANGDGDSAGGSKRKLKKGDALSPLEVPSSPTIMARKEASFGAASPPSPLIGQWSGTSKARGNKVAPEPHLQSWGSGGIPAGPHPPAGGAVGGATNGSSMSGDSPPAGLHPHIHSSGAPHGPSVPSDVALRLEAERAAQLAGQAFAYAQQAQTMLDHVARTNSQLSARSGPSSPMAAPPGGGYAGPASPSAPPAYGFGPGSPSAPSPGYGYPSGPRM